MSIKTLGSIVVLLMAVAAISASSASAMALCGENEESCSPENTFGVPAELEFELAGGSEAIFDGLLEVECGTSTAVGETTEESGSLLIAEITSLNFSACEGGCTPEVQNLPYKVEMSATAEGDGALAVSSGGSGNPRVAIDCGGFECVYGSSAVELAFAGGEPGEVTAQEEELKKESGSFLCGSSSAKWTATYEVVSYESLFFVSGGQPTTLCEAKPNLIGSEFLECPGGKEWGGELKGEMTGGRKFLFASNEGIAAGVECTSSTLAGKFNVNGTSAKGQGITALTFTNGKDKNGNDIPCTSKLLPGTPPVTMVAESFPYSRSTISYFGPTEPEGIGALRKPKLDTPKLKMIYGMVTCPYEQTLSVNTFFNDTGTTPSQYRLTGTWKRTNADVTNCPGKLAMEGRLDIAQATGGKVYVAER